MPKTGMLFHNPPNPDPSFYLYGFHSTCPQRCMGRKNPVDEGIIQDCIPGHSYQCCMLIAAIACCDFLHNFSVPLHAAAMP